ncbi:MAG: pyridoxamine kinase [Bacteroidales bacterium]|nr:pyridoxamine kinase [Bacteroidales bacterium]
MSKKIAIINDISGYGRCSISVIQPIVSHLGVQGCPVPTAIFSNHTGFPSFFCKDFTRYMQSYIDEWKKLDLHFDAIMTGFLGSAQQIGIVEQFIRDFADPETTVLVDPVMGDNGHIYPTYTRKMCREMKKLIAYADILTPNITEACFLTDTPYKESGWKHAELAEIAQKLQAMGAKKLVITGIRMGDNYIGNAVCSEGGEMEFQRQMVVQQTRSGTGDVFASVLGADAVNGVDFPTSVKRASNFVRRCLIETAKGTAPLNTGIDFESQLYKLKRC